jgi:virginiamycin B lyase
MTLLASLAQAVRRRARPTRSVRPHLGVPLLEPRTLLAYAITELRIPLARPDADSLVTGPDGAVWTIARQFNSSLFRDEHFLTRFDAATGASTRVRIPSTARAVEDLASGPAGRLWFVEDSRTITSYEPASGAFASTSLTTQDLISDMVGGPDGNLWVATQFTGPTPAASAVQIVRMSPAGGTPARFTVTPGGSVYAPGGLVFGPDTRLYFGIDNTRIGRMTLAGQLTTFTVANPGNIAVAGDGGVWVSSFANDNVIRIDPANPAQRASVPLPTGSEPLGLAIGSDGAVWAALSGTNQLARIDPGTRAVTLLAAPRTLYDGKLLPESPWDLLAGPDGNLWYSQASGFERIGVVQLAATAPAAGFKTLEGGTIPSDFTTPPRVLSASVLTTGRGANRRLVGFRLVSDQRLDAASVGATGTFTLTASVRSGPRTVQKPVRFRATLDRTGRAVSLTLLSRANPFANGGRLVVTARLANTLGVTVDTPRTFVIAAQARSIR